MSGRETPSRILLEALLEYSRRRRRPHHPHHPPQPSSSNEEQRDLPIPQAQQDANEFRDGNYSRTASTGPIGVIQPRIAGTGPTGVLQPPRIAGTSPTGVFQPPRIAGTSPTGVLQPPRIAGTSPTGVFQPRIAGTGPSGVLQHTRTKVFQNVGEDNVGSFEKIKNLSSIPSSLQSENGMQNENQSQNSIGDAGTLDLTGVDNDEVKSILGYGLGDDSTVEAGAKLIAKPIYSENPLYFDKDVIGLEVETANSCVCTCCTSTHHVHPELKDGDGPAQTSFIQNVFVVLALKTIVILGWLKAVEYVNVLQEHYEEYYKYHYISGAAYLIIKLLIRMMSVCRKRYYCTYFCLFILETIAASDFLEAIVTSNGGDWLNGKFIVPRRILYCLVGTYLFFIVVANFVTYDMQDRIMMGTALIITAILAIHQFLYTKSTISLNLEKNHTHQLLDEVVSSLTILAFSEVIITMIMFEFQSVLAGRRYNLATKDWFFTALYVI